MKSDFSPQHPETDRTDSSLIQHIGDAISAAQQLLTWFVQQGAFNVDDLAVAFGSGVNIMVLNNLAEQFGSGDYRSLPNIDVRPAEKLAGANGVYIATFNQIYLSDQFVAQASQAQLVAVILEEMGHALDIQLNTVDSAGDEGSIFANLVLEKRMSETYMATPHATELSNDVNFRELDRGWNQHGNYRSGEVVHRISDNDIILGSIHVTSQPLTSSLRLYPLHSNC